MITKKKWKIGPDYQKTVKNWPCLPTQEKEAETRNWKKENYDRRCKKFYATKVT